MKIGFFLQRNFAPVGDAIAASVQEHYGISEFCAFVQSRSSLRYIQEKSTVTYSSLLLDEDVHELYRKEILDMNYLRALEKEYGIPNLWPYLSPDRVLMSSQLIREYPYDTPLKSHEDLLRILQATAKGVAKFLDEEKPDALVFSIVGSLGALLLYHMGKKRGISTHVVCPALFENKFLFSELHDGLSLRHELGISFDTPVSEHARREAEAFLQSFRERPRPYASAFLHDDQQTSRKEQFQFLLPNNAGRSWRALLAEYRRWWGDPHRHDYSNVNPNHYMIDRIRRKLRNMRGLSDLYDTPRSGEPFAFFPLHLEPEVALSISAPLITDQLYAITHAARALPVGWKLYVKEHPRMVEFRPRSFYERAKKIPNVKLIDPSMKSFGLIAESRLNIVITSTVGFEASLLGKPVITLGKQFFNDFSFVKHCDSMGDLARLVKEQVEHFAYDEKEIVHFLAKVIDTAATVDLNRMWYQQSTPEELKNGARPLADLLMRRLGKTRPSSISR